MTSQSSTNLVHFTRLKRNVYGAALETLKVNDPSYVESFSKDPEGTSEKKPTKGLPKKWQEIMESLVSYEFAMQDVKLALKLLDRECPFPDTVCTKGQWVEFQFNTWMNTTYSWQQKLELLVKRVCRRLSAAHDLDTQTLSDLTEYLRLMWTTFNDKRGEYVHETGAVSAISKHPGWEVPLLLEGDVATYPYLRDREASVSRREYRHKLLLTATTQQLAKLEGFFEQLNKTLFSGEQT